MDPQTSPTKLSVFSGSNSVENTSQTTRPHSSNQATPQPAAALLPVAVRDLVPLLVDAFQTDRTWLKDFGREQIHVSADLYDILLAYQQFRRYDAA